LNFKSYEEGELTEKVTSQPFSVILFDEVDKANPSIVKILIQLLGDGMLTDGKGRAVDFKNTIIIMTSNLGTENLSTRIAGENMETTRDLVMKKVCENSQATNGKVINVHLPIVIYACSCRLRNASSMNLSTS
jgi:ATP-dependent Clp protease ATP-binding subunit ClpA